MINLGLSRITNLLSRFPPPTWTAIHIAGTNGKGSVAAYLTAFFLRLSTAKDGDLRIGRFTSPHLIDRWDCITINDSPVSKSLFLSVENEIKSLAGRNSSNSDSGSSNNASKTTNSDAEAPTEFELLTATAFQIFTQQKCQLAIIECGLGGRLDATNALKPTEVVVSVITKIGLDHQNLLGDTVEAIAREKAGIIKEGHIVVVDGSNLDSVKNAIENTARDIRDVEILFTTSITASTNADTTANYSSIMPPTETQSLAIPPHQKENLEVALLAFQCAHPRISTLTTQFPRTSQILPQILRDVKNSPSSKGRLQRLSVSSLIPSFEDEVLLDGAHNAQSATVLRQYIDDSLLTSRLHTQKHTQTSTGVTWVIAMSRGKDISEILSILLRPEDQVVACPFGAVDGMPWVRCVEPAQIAEVAGAMVKSEVVTCDDVVEALRTTTALAGGHSGAHDSPVVVAGSLYLVSDLLRTIRESNVE